MVSIRDAASAGYGGVVMERTERETLEGTNVPGKSEDTVGGLVEEVPMQTFGGAIRRREFMLPLQMFYRP